MDSFLVLTSCWKKYIRSLFPCLPILFSLFRMYPPCHSLHIFYHSFLARSYCYDPVCIGHFSYFVALFVMIPGSLDWLIIQLHSFIWIPFFVSHVIYVTPSGLKARNTLDWLILYRLHSYLHKEKTFCCIYIKSALLAGLERYMKLRNKQDPQQISRSISWRKDKHSSPA